MQKVLLFIILFVASNSYAATEKEMIAKSLSGDYQSQRNLAYSYSKGWGKPDDGDYIPKNPIYSCAWRKVILITNTKNANDVDYANESIDCKTVHPTENQQVWKVTFAILQEVGNKLH